jgi:DNA repair protein RecO (recombination protein O)
VPLYTADALILRTYKLAEADRIAVFLTCDRGKKRGVAKGARRPRSAFTGALEPLTHVHVAYFEREHRELVSLNYAETLRSPLSADRVELLGSATYFAELIDACAADADCDERLYRLGASMVEALTAAGSPERLARYFEYWLLRLQGVYPPHLVCRQCGCPLGGAPGGAYLRPDGNRFTCVACAPVEVVEAGAFRLSPGALAFLHEMRGLAPRQLDQAPVAEEAVRELEAVHRVLIRLHLEKEPKSMRVLRQVSA